MDASKRETVISIVRALWQKEDTNILDLKSGHFYIHLLEMLEQWDKSVNHSSDEDRLMSTKLFLQDYYGNERETRIDNFLKFDSILHEDALEFDENKMELELAKIAIVLLGIGVLDKNSEKFMAAVLRVPFEKHFEVIEIIQSVVQAGSSEVSLTSRIEDILCEPAASHCDTNTEPLIAWLQRTQNFYSLATKERGTSSGVSPFKSDNSQGVRPNTPICNLLRTSMIEPPEASTPKDLNKSWTSAAVASSSGLHRSPLRVNLALLNSSLRDITSPLRGLSIDTSSPCSPLTQYAQSPQLIQKAILRQKETELRKLRRQMEEHIDGADELKYLLQDQTEIVAERDATISQLEKKIQELHRQNLHTELKESEDAENKETVEMLTQRVKSLEQYKSQYMILETESSLHAEEIRKLNCEITSLEQKNSEYKSILDSQKHFGEDIEEKQMQIKAAMQQLEQMKDAQKEWESERQYMQEKINSLKEQNASLRHEAEDCYPSEPGHTSGENMAVVLDIQFEELRSQLDKTNLEQERCQTLLQEKQELLSQSEIDLQKLQDELNNTQSKLAESNKVSDHQSTILDQQTKDLNALRGQLETEMKLKNNLLQENEIMQNDIDEKNKQCADYLGQISNLSRQTIQKDEFISDMENKLQQRDSNLKDLQGQVSSKDKQLEYVNAQAETLNASMQSLSEQLSNKENQVETMNASMQSLSEQLSNKENQVETLNASMQSLSEQLSNKENQIETLNASMQSLSEQLSNKENQIAQLRQDGDVVLRENQSKQEEFKVQIEEMKEQKVELKSSHALELSNMNEKHQKVVKELEQVAEQSRVQCEALQNLSSKQNNELVERKTNVSALSNSLELKSKQLSEKEEYIAQLKNDFKIQFEEMYQNKCELKASIENLQKELDGMIQQFEAIERELGLKTKEVKHKEEQIKNIQSDFEVKAKADEVRSKEALEALKAELDALRTQEILKFSQQIEMEKAEAAKRISAKNAQIEELERNIEEIANEKILMCVKLEDSEKERKEAKAQLQLKLKDVAEKEDVIETMKLEYEKLFSSASKNEGDLEKLHANVESMKEQHTQILSQKDDFHESQKSEIKRQHEQEMGEILQKMEDKDTLNATLQKTVADKSCELDNFEAKLNELRSSLKMKDAEISSNEETIVKFEKLSIEKDVIIENLRGEFAVKESNHDSAFKEANNKLRALEEEKTETLLKQKSLEAEIANQIVKHQEEVNKLIQANQDAEESHQQALRDAEEKSDELLNQERNEHSKLLEAIGQDSDKEREGYLQSLLLKRQEVEKLAGELKDVQKENLSRQKECLDLKEELERVNAKLKSAGQKHDQDADLLSVQVSKTQELDQMYQDLQIKLEQVEEILAQSYSDLKDANEISRQQTDDLSQAKSQVEKLEQDLGKLHNNNLISKEQNEYLQAKLDEHERAMSEENESHQQMILEKDTLISNLSKEKEEKAAKLAEQQKTLSDQVAELENLKLSHKSAETSILKNEELVCQLQQDIANKEVLITKMKEDFEENHLTAQQEHKTLIDDLELKYKAAKECELKALADQEAKFMSEIEKIESEKDKQLEDLMTAKLHLEKEIQILKSDLDEKNQQNLDGIEELDVLARKISEGHCQVSVMTQKLEESDTKLLAYQREIEDKDTKLLAYQREIEGKDTKLLAYQREIEDKDTKLLAYQREIEGKDTKLLAYQREIEDKDTKLLAYQREIEDKDTKLQAMENELKANVEEICEKEQIVDALKTDFAKKINWLKEENKESQMEIQSKFEENLKSEISKAAEQQIALDRYKDQLDELQLRHNSEVQELTEQISQLHAKISELEDQLKCYISQNNENQSLLRQSEAEAEDLLLKNEHLEQLEQSHTAQLNENQEKLKQKTEEAAGLQLELELYTSQFSQQKDVLNDREKTVRGLQVQVENLEFQANQDKENLRQKEIEISNLCEQMKYYESQVLQSEEFHKEKEQEVADLKQRVEYLQNIEKSRLEQHQTCLEQKEAEAAELALKLKHHEEAERAQVENFQQILGQKNKQVSDLTIEKEHLQTAHATLMKQQESNKMCLKRKDEEIDNLKIKVDVEQEMKRKQFDEMSTQAANMKAEVDSLKIHLAKKEKERMSEEKKYKYACEQNAHLEKQVLSLKESNDNLAHSLKAEKEKNNKSKLSDMTLKFETMQKENKQYASEVNKLKTALDFSERKLRDYQKQLEAAGTVLLGDNSHFQKTFAKSSGHVSPEGSPDSIGSSRSLRSMSRLSSGNNSFQSGLNETILSGDTVLLKRETIATSADLKKKPKPLRTTEDRLSVCSTTSAQSTRSARGLPAIRMPFATCENEPEGPDFEWDRLSELQRRNTMYLPHLKSAYPVEMQTVKKDKLSDDGLRLSTVANSIHGKSDLLASKESKYESLGHVTSAKTNLTKSEMGVKALKRNAPMMNLKEEIFEPSPPKQKKQIETSPTGTMMYYPVVRTAPNYHRPGPPTPGKVPRRVSGSFSPDQALSPASVGKSMALGSPITRGQARLTPKTRARKSPRVAASPSASSKQAEKQQSVAFQIGFSPMGKARRSPRLKASPVTSMARKHDKLNESVAFDVGFSPMASTGQMRPPKKAGLMAKKKLTKPFATASSKVPEPAPQKFRRPLATRNFLETGI